MRKGIRKCLCVVMAAAVLFGGVWVPMSAEAQEREISPQSGEQGVTVTTREEFMTALQEHRSPIIVNNFIGIGKEAEASGRMLPVKIPANTVIRGTSSTSELCSRSPIQLEGDGVCFQNIKLTLESSDALGSVPHREIFLAGHSLTLDNVSTYLEGGSGGMGGTEEELLPTIYAGGYTGTAVGENAALTVRNSNDKTVFQAIYMGHEAGSDKNVPYKKKAVLNLDAKATVRENVDTSHNSQAEVNISGTNTSQYAKTKEFRGNSETTLTLSSVTMDQAVLNQIGNLVLKDEAHMILKSDYLQNVMLQSGACLDFNGVMNPVIEGSFAGVSSSGEKRGILVLNQEGLLMIAGKVTGTTQFQTKSRLFPTTPLKKEYILASGSTSASCFVLASKFIGEGYALNFGNGVWTVGEKEEAFREVGSIKIHSAPSSVDLKKILVKDIGEIPDEEIYFEVIWYDTEGNPFSHHEVIDENYLFFEADCVLRIRTDYWNSDSEAILNKEDWGQAVTLTTDEKEEHEGKYYLQAFDGTNGTNKAVPGDYTFLFFGTPFYSEDLVTVADVKDLKDMVMEERNVTFYSQDTEEPSKPEHNHTYQSVVKRQPTCAETGIRMYTCSCGDTYTKEIPVLSHKYVRKCIPATPTKSGKVQNVCSVCSRTTEVSAIASPKKITLSKTDYSYDGKVKTPSVTVTNSKGAKLKAGTDYQVSYPKGRKNPGVYTVTVKFRGNYSGTMKKTFTVRPKKTALKTIAARSKGMQVTWKKQTTQMDGYQIQYSTKGNFKGATTKMTTAKRSASIKKISKLKGKQKYYVRIRTYKTVKVNGKSKKLYSDWSSKKTVRTKK